MFDLSYVRVIESSNYQMFELSYVLVIESSSYIVLVHYNILCECTSCLRYLDKETWTFKFSCFLKLIEKENYRKIIEIHKKKNKN